MGGDDLGYPSGTLQVHSIRRIIVRTDNHVVTNAKQDASVLGCPQVPKDSMCLGDVVNVHFVNPSGKKINCNQAFWPFSFRQVQ
jgi:hypothetical protein